MNQYITKSYDTIVAVLSRFIITALHPTPTTATAASHSGSSTALSGSENSHPKGRTYSATAAAHTGIQAARAATFPAQKLHKKYAAIDSAALTIYENTMFSAI